MRLFYNYACNNASRMDYREHMSGSEGDGERIYTRCKAGVRIRAKERQSRHSSQMEGKRRWFRSLFSLS
jgi:hypothetical protein